MSAAVEDWFVYILRCADNTLYTGITKNIERRCKQHNAAVASKYTRARLPVVLVYQETVASHGDALRRELAIKKMNRAAKAAMCSTWTAK